MTGEMKVREVSTNMVKMGVLIPVVALKDLAKVNIASPYL